MADDIFDFGFTVVNEDELEVAQKATKTAETAVAGAKTTETKLNNLYNAIIPLLTNLKANPEKDYILWPKRLEKVEAFEDMLQKIYKG
jgi:hypothetical protein|tara:strand:- start:123 stop:386 length:264 start_codon:yes stop_codon:yes gene_type:complete